MTLVVDASVAIKFVVREIKTDEARRLLSIPDPLIAPDWLLVEAASALWRKVKRSELLAIHAKRHLDDLPLFFGRLHPSCELVTEAFELAIRLRHPVYDCLYLALAQREDVRLVTADGEFHAALTKAGMADRVDLL